ncbi:hypothetical protein HZH68_001691 [Vespula germanica]|uniref:Uncharacterized protein n=1 Tax=Vespula germanica TaxID=30212 RepID=A0A834NW15_VESGE|nr:hypothetical protein HZH68_001691 [Vespula germanica]
MAQDDESKKSSRREGLVARASPSSFLLALLWCFGDCIAPSRLTGLRRERILPTRSEGLRIAAVPVQCLCRGDTQIAVLEDKKKRYMLGLSTITYNTTDNIFPEHVALEPVLVYVNLYFGVYLLKSSNKLLRDHYHPA